MKRRSRRHIRYIGLRPNKQGTGWETQRRIVIEGIRVEMALWQPVQPRKINPSMHLHILHRYTD